MEITKERNERLDIMKGILILLVVWGHAIQYGFSFEYAENFIYLEDQVFKFIYSFHMPLFMAISGYLFYYSINKGFYQIVRNKIKGILSPYLFYCTLLAIISFSAWSHDFIGLLRIYANGFWFLTSVLINMFVVGIVASLIKKKFLRGTLLIILSMSVIFIPEDYLYSTHAFVFPAFVIGFLINEHGLHLRKEKWMCIPSMISLFITPFLFNKDLFIYTTGINICDWGGKFIGVN